MPSLLLHHQHWLTLVRQLISSSALLILVLAIFAPLEAFFAVQTSRFFYKGWAVDLAWYFVNAITPILLLGPPAALLAWGVHAVLPDSVTGAGASFPLWLRMVLAMVVGELGFYWGHRWSHEIPLLWRFHAIHHSAEHVGFLVNTRAHPVDMVFTRLCGMVLLYATGLASPVGPHPTLIPAIVLFVGSLWSYFIHANVRWRLGPLEEVLSSPFFHHWHHTRNDHKDRNYASMLPIMDRVFGTHIAPAHWPTDYGTDSPVPTSLLGQLLDPIAPAGPPRADLTKAA